MHYLYHVGVNSNHLINGMSYCLAVAQLLFCFCVASGFCALKRMQFYLNLLCNK